MIKTSRVRREQGFTLIELLIVSIIVGILATLVAMTYSGVQAKNRNADRQADVNALQSELETYYAQKSQYPSLSQLSDPTWRKANMKDLSEDTLTDPQWNEDVKECGAKGLPAPAALPADMCYSYQATAPDGSACSAEIACAQYTITAVLEGGEKYVKSSLN